MFVNILGAALVAGYFMSSVQAIATISANGAKFFTSDGNQFFLKGMKLYISQGRALLTLVSGVAYQLTPDDPLLDTDQCTRDATLMKSIGTNSIRVYHVDPTQDHSSCMGIFADAGIYLWLDLDTFTSAMYQVSLHKRNHMRKIQLTYLQSEPAWTNSQYSAFSAVMDAFQSYDNTAGFWIGNEVINSAAGSGAAPYVKAAVRDMKAYRNSKGYRSIPIGYSAADIAELRPMLQDYLACGDSADTIEFFGLNSYEWCGSDATYETSGYSTLNNMTVGYSIPIFFSETGCNVGGARTFADQAAIFGSDMVDTWSGAIIYEWVQETNDYGLVSYGDGALSGTPTPIAPDFTNLASQWATLTPTGVSSAAYTPSLSAPACPSSTAGGWLVDGDVALPSVSGAWPTSTSTTSRTSTSATTTTTSSSAASGTTSSSSSSASASSSMATKTSASAASTASAAPSSSSSGAAAGVHVKGAICGLAGVVMFMFGVM